MVTVFPSALVFVPLAVVCSIKRKWALIFFLMSVPLFDVTIFTAISHDFTVPEISILIIIFSVVTGLRNKNVFIIKDRLFLVSFASFLVIIGISFVLLIVQPASIAVNPYGSSPDRFTLSLVSASFSNVTQLLLRLFFFASVFSIGLTVHSDEVRYIIRSVILGSIFAGTIGIVYQLFLLFDSDLMIRFLYWFGGTGQLGGMGMVGPIPRMGSVAGEPGHTAQYLLYTFAVSATLLLTGSYNVFTERVLPVVTTVLGGLLLMTTSGTAYGGLVIFAALMSTILFFYDRSRVFRLIGRFKFHFILIMVLMSIVLILDIDLVKNVIIQQYEKLTFRSGSGTIRSRYFMLTVDVLSERPLFGLGIGSYYSTSLGGTILGETGILGIIVFLSFCLGCLRPMMSRAIQYWPDAQLEFALFIGAITITLTSLVAKSITTLLSPWFWVALGLPVSLALVQMEGN